MRNRQPTSSKCNSPSAEEVVGSLVSWQRVCCSPGAVLGPEDAVRSRAAQALARGWDILGVTDIGEALSEPATASNNVNVGK